MGYSLDSVIFLACVSYITFLRVCFLIYKLGVTVVALVVVSVK